MKTLKCWTPASKTDTLLKYALAEKKKWRRLCQCVEKTWSSRPAPTQFCKCWRVMSMRTSILSATAHRLSFLSPSESLNTPANCCTYFGDTQSIWCKCLIKRKHANQYSYLTSRTNTTCFIFLQYLIKFHVKNKDFTAVILSNYVFPSYFNLIIQFKVQHDIKDSSNFPDHGNSQEL